MAVQAHSLGLGVQWNYSAGYLRAPGMAFLVSPSRVTHFAFNWFFADTSVVGLTFDVVPIILPLSTNVLGGSFNFTLGAGLYTNLVFGDDLGMDLGLRVPIGFNLLLANNIFEIFTHMAPSFGLRFLPNLDVASPFFPLAIGARVWLR